MTIEPHDPEQQRTDDDERSGGESPPAGDGAGAGGGGEAGAAGEGGEAGAAGEGGAEPGGDGPEARVAELEKQAEELRDKWMRATADLENTRRRARKDVEEARLDGQKRALGEILPVIDNLERALEHAGAAASEDAQGIAEGVNLVMRQFSQALDRLGVSPIEAEGNPFDPTYHEAMSQVETDEVSPGTVAQVLQRGYVLGERLLRPSLVVVAKAKEREESAGPNGRGPDEGEA